MGLCNKEALVLAGGLINELLDKYKGKIVPIDSEHSALYQCLLGRPLNQVRSLVLTASGGPFLDLPASQFSKITKQQALNHPRWSMGEKITVDSATMMNKGLEIIEAAHLFRIPVDKIKSLVHPQSLVHGVVEFEDGHSLALIGQPDMRLPIAFCLGELSKVTSGVACLDLAAQGALEFREVDHQKFPAIKLACRAFLFGSGAPAFLNGANQRLVELFLAKKISFAILISGLKATLAELERLFAAPQTAPSYLVKLGSIEDSLAADRYGQKFIDGYVNV